MDKKLQTIVIVAILIIPAAGILGLNAWEKKHPNTTAVANTTQTSSATPEPTATASASAVPSGTPQEIATKAGYTVPPDAVSATKVTLKTEKGDIHFILYPDVAPLSVLNFVTLGKRGYYNGVIFHRVLKDFVIQAGDPTGTGRGGESIYGKGFTTETNTSYTFQPGTLGMARTADPNSNGSQFFVVTESPQSSLDGSYTVFGKVADDASMTVVKAIAAVPVNNSTDGKPVTDVKITGFTIEQ
jgi:cyclophilin family peptidyl-prolyl cis-trans isomerase